LVVVRVWGGYVYDVDIGVFDELFVGAVGTGGGWGADRSEELGGTGC
jgi:hypothetical protein